MFVFCRPGLRCEPLRLLPRLPFLDEPRLFFVLAKAADVVSISVAPIIKVNARKEERIVFMHYSARERQKFAVK
jgi:hypothetical protein